MTVDKKPSNLVGSQKKKLIFYRKTFEKTV